jgi:hypothetical protein
VSRRHAIRLERSTSWAACQIWGDAIAGTSRTIFFRFWFLLRLPKFTGLTLAMNNSSRMLSLVDLASWKQLALQHDATPSQPSTADVDYRGCQSSNFAAV